MQHLEQWRYWLDPGALINFCLQNECARYSVTMKNVLVERKKPPNRKAPFFFVQLTLKRMDRNPLCCNSGQLPTLSYRDTHNWFHATIQQEETLCKCTIYLHKRKEFSGPAIVNLFFPAQQTFKWVQFLAKITDDISHACSKSCPLSLHFKGRKVQPFQVRRITSLGFFSFPRVIQLHRR